MNETTEKRLLDIDVILIISIFICILVSIKKFSLIEMNQSQILYLFSMEAQVVAALFALTITGYIFYSHYTTNKLNEDSDLHGIIEVHKTNSNSRLKYIATISIIAIIFCIANIVLLNCLNGVAYLQNLLLNLGNVFAIFSIINIIIFSINILNPDIKKISTEEISQNTSLPFQEGDKTPEEKKSRLDEFLMYYDLLVKEVVSLALMIQQKKYSNYNAGVNLLKASRILINNSIIDESYKERIDSIMVYRNLLFHSDQLLVDYEKYSELRRIYNDISIKVKTYKEEVLHE